MISRQRKRIMNIEVLIYNSILMHTECLRALGMIIRDCPNILQRYEIFLFNIIKVKKIQVLQTYGLACKLFMLLKELNA